MYLPILKESKVFAGRHHFCELSKLTLKIHQRIWSLVLSAKWAEGSVPSCSSPLGGEDHKNTSRDSMAL